MWNLINNTYLAHSRHHFHWNRLRCVSINWVLVFATDKPILMPLIKLIEKWKSSRLLHKTPKRFGTPLTSYSSTFTKINNSCIFNLLSQQFNRNAFGRANLRRHWCNFTTQSNQRTTWLFTSLLGSLFSFSPFPSFAHFSSTCYRYSVTRVRLAAFSHHVFHRCSFHSGKENITRICTVKGVFCANGQKDEKANQNSLWIFCYWFFFFAFFSKKKEVECIIVLFEWNKLNLQLKIYYSFHTRFPTFHNHIQYINRSMYAYEKQNTNKLKL